MKAKKGLFNGGSVELDKRQISRQVLKKLEGFSRHQDAGVEHAVGADAPRTERPQITRLVGNNGKDSVDEGTSCAASLRKRSRGDDAEDREVKKSKSISRAEEGEVEENAGGLFPASMLESPATPRKTAHASWTRMPYPPTPCPARAQPDVSMTPTPTRDEGGQVLVPSTSLQRPSDDRAASGTPDMPDLGMTAPPSLLAERVTVRDTNQIAGPASSDGRGSSVADDDEVLLPFTLTFGPPSLWGQSCLNGGPSLQPQLSEDCFPPLTCDFPDGLQTQPSSPSGTIGWERSSGGDLYSTKERHSPFVQPSVSPEISTPDTQYSMDIPASDLIKALDEEDDRAPAYFMPASQFYL